MKFYEVAKFTSWMEPPTIHFLQQISKNSSITFEKILLVSLAHFLLQIPKTHPCTY
jgi:hypothetical protein